MEINISSLNYTKSNKYGGLYTFTPDNTFKEYLMSEGEETRIVVTNILLNNNKNKYKIEMGNNSDYLDTAKMEEKLRNNQAVDLGHIKNINIYHLESLTKGCKFELTTNETNKVSYRTFNLECQEINSHKNRSIKCSQNKNSNKIECNLDENINNNCTLKNYLEYNKNEIYSIFSNEQNITPMTCPIIKQNNKHNIFRTTSSSGLTKASIILIILAPIVAIIIMVSIYIYMKYKKNKEIISNISKKDNTKDTVTYILD